MAKVDFADAIKHVAGALDTDHKIIVRQKHLHDSNGAQTKMCGPEIFIRSNKRDYTHVPPQGNELAHLQHFGEAAKRTTALIYAYKFPDTASDDQRALLEEYRRRFESQLKGKPDPQAPFDKAGKQKYYFRFDNFVRAMIYQKLKS